MNLMDLLGRRKKKKVAFHDIVTWISSHMIAVSPSSKTKQSPYCNHKSVVHKRLVLDTGTLCLTIVYRTRFSLVLSSALLSTRSCVTYLLSISLQIENSFLHMPTPAVLLLLAAKLFQSRYYPLVCICTLYSTMGFHCLCIKKIKG